MSKLLATRILENIEGTAKIQARLLARRLLEGRVGLGQGAGSSLGIEAVELAWPVEDLLVGRHECRPVRPCGCDDDAVDRIPGQRTEVEGVEDDLCCDHFFPQPEGEKPGSYRGKSLAKPHFRPVYRHAELPPSQGRYGNAVWH